MADAPRAAATTSTPTFDVNTEALQSMVLDQRGFVYDLLGSKKRQSITSLDFAVVWNAFVDLVAKATREPSSRQLDRSNVNKHDSATRALDRFLGVMKHEYVNEDTFRMAMLGALEISLGAASTYCEPSSLKRAAAGSDAAVVKRPAAASSEALIRLRSGCNGKCRIGFGVCVDRNENLHLGLNHGVGMSNSNSSSTSSNISCVVLRDDNVWDATAVVELKIGDSSCEAYDFQGMPSWDMPHAPFLQALVNVLDTWHCLARRGQRVESHDHLQEPEMSLPIAVVAARRKGQSSANRLCCVEGSLDIPTTLGEEFQFRINRCVNLPKKNDDAEADSMYTQALAVFIKVLSVGLSYAIKLVNDPTKSAITLCCSPPHADLQLLASPIPSAKKSGWTISQGELHRCTRSIALQEWANEFGEYWDSCIFAEPQTPMNNCIVKVSCISVHNWLIPSDESWECVRSIGNNDEAQELKVAMASVLYASLYCPPSGMLIMIMKDLTHSRINPEHLAAVVSLHGFDTPRARWEAFGRLVTNWLLPMARNDVIHYDIRFDPGSWKMCNVVREDAAELTLIDFESLTHYGMGRTKKYQAYAISKMHVGSSFSPFHFLFWQVLFVAYVWHPQTTKENLVMAIDFVKLFTFPSEKLKSFIDAIGYDAVAELKTCATALSQRGNEATNEAQVVKAMSVLHDIYRAL